MKIAIVCSKFPPIVGGGETIVYNQAKELGLRGHKVSVITSNISKKYQPIKENVLFEKYYIDGLEDFCVGKGSFKDVSERLYNILVKLNADVVHVHNFVPMFLISLFAKEFTSKIVFTYHNTPNPPKRILGYFSQYEMDEAFAMKVVNDSSYDLLLAGSEFYYDWAIRLGSKAHKTKLFYFWVDRSMFNPSLLSNKSEFRAKYRIPQDNFLITLPSRIIERKGILDAIRALKLLENNDLTPLLFLPTLYLPFDSKYASKVKDEIRKLGLEEQVIIPDSHIPYDQMPGVYAMSDLIIMPSHHEGLGLALLEAMSMGVPVIGTKVNGIKEIIKDGQNGLLVQSKSSQDLAKAILTLTNDKGMTERVKQNGIQFIEKKFSPKNLVAKLENYYQTLINQS